MRTPHRFATEAENSFSGIIREVGVDVSISLLRASSNSVRSFRRRLFSSNLDSKQSKNYAIEQGQWATHTKNP